MFPKLEAAGGSSVGTNMTFCTAILDQQRPSCRESKLGPGNDDAGGLGMRDNSGYQSFSMNCKMTLRSGREKPYRVPTCGRQLVRRKLLESTRSAAAENSELQLRKTLRCYIQTEDSKTVHFSLDERGRHEISTTDSQLPAAKTNSKNVVVLMQRLKCNEFVLLSKGENQLCLKVLKGCCSEPDHASVKGGNAKTCKEGSLDFRKLQEENHFFIMHSEGDSVKFQCYQDTSYFLHVNENSLDIRKLDRKDPDGERNFIFKVTYF
ncbi:uncharacterized protein LOC110389404 isoform X2 [Numida meleagris]|uniref:uncharacterized protein LOC110389404 isoform X2 n=1 Tax=Numida meleagris TaxID=8996 RepID=UPI000B3D8FBC|nr:uncharacterized protein LOC110389404 isoform X2 [Numida meleagris]